MIIKLDIKKSYEKVDFLFLCNCMEAFGFNKRWKNWIFFYISPPWFLVIVNGTPKGFFETSRGLRQGDPLSPFLFIIMAEELGKGILESKRLGKIVGI